MLSGTVEGFGQKTNTGASCATGTLTQIPSGATATSVSGYANNWACLNNKAGVTAVMANNADWSEPTVAAVTKPSGAKTSGAANNGEPCTSTNGCAAPDDKCVDRAGKESSSGTCLTAAQITALKDNAKAPTVGKGGASKDAATWMTGAGNDKKFCGGATHAGDAVCRVFDPNPTKCNDDNLCEITPCDAKLEPGSGDTLSSTTYSNLFRCLNRKRTLAEETDTGNLFSNTDLIPGVDVRGNNRMGKKAPPTPECGRLDRAPNINFYDWLGCSLDDKTGQVTCPHLGDIPEIQGAVERSMTQCAKGWISNGFVKKSALWINNSGGDKNKGGRPFMGYNHESGLVCRNPFYKDIKIEGSIPRFMCGASCPDKKSKEGCFSDKTIWPKKDSVPERLTNTIVNFLGMGEECTSPSIRKDYPGLCGIPTLKDSAGDVADYYWNLVPVGTPQTCNN